MARHRQAPAKTEVSYLIEEAQERGVDTEAMFCVYVYENGEMDCDFLKRKMAERKKHPDIAKRWDATFPNDSRFNGRDPMVDQYEWHSKYNPNFNGSIHDRIAESNPFLVLICLFAFCLIIIVAFSGTGVIDKAGREINHFNDSAAEFRQFQAAEDARPDSPGRVEWIKDAADYANDYSGEIERLRDKNH